MLGFAAAFLGMLGGLARGGHLLKVLAWARFRGQIGDYDTGVRYVCGGTSGNQTCAKWSDVDCSTLRMHKTCQVCKHQTSVMIAPLVICVITYALFAHNTWKRYTGRDSSQVKIMSCFACFWAGTNFLLVLLAFWQSCVALKKDSDLHSLKHGDEVSIGLGLLLISAGGTGCKYICGILHLGLPVEVADGLKTLDDSDSDTSDSVGDTETESEAVQVQLITLHVQDRSGEEILTLSLPCGTPGEEARHQVAEALGAPLADFSLMETERSRMVRQGVVLDADATVVAFAPPRGG